MSDSPVCAWRIGRRRNGQPVKRLVVRTSDYPAMVRWLARSRAARRPHRHTLWIDEEDRPGTTVVPRTYWRRT
jgi:hypothetical protein